MDNLPLTTEPFLTGKPQEVWLASMGIKDWSINDGLVDVKGNVDIRGKLGGLKRLPVRFGKVGGGFWCEDNKLVSLEGAPKEVGGRFACNHNYLVSLEGAPKKVGGTFDCNHNLLVDFKGMEVTSIRGRFFVTNPRTYGYDNVFVSLEGLPKELLCKLEGLDVQAILELEQKRASSLSVAELKMELNSEVELG